MQMLTPRRYGLALAKLMLTPIHSQQVLETSTRLPMRIIRYRLAGIFLSVILIPTTYLTTPVKEYIEDSISQGILLFGAARLVNAGVSVLQSTQGSAGLASMQFGAVLDPVDDMVENFSSVMTWAIGALFTQKFALSLAELPMVGIIISIIGLASVILGMLRLDKASSYVWRIFTSTFLAKIGLVASIYLSMWISAVILDASIEEAGPALSQFGDKIDQLTGREKVEIPGDELLSEMKDTISAADAEIDQLEKNLSEREAELAEMPSSWLPWKKDPARDEIKDEIAESKQKLASLKEIRDTTDSDLKCIEAAIGGDSCQSFFSRLWHIKPSAAVDVIAASSGVINSLLLLSAALIIKTILLPILSMNFVLRSLWRYATRSNSL